MGLTAVIQRRERARLAAVAANRRPQAPHDETARSGFTLVRRDRLASLGQLAASVAHEINNPLSGVLNYTMLMERILRPDGVPQGRIEEFRGYLGLLSDLEAQPDKRVTLWKGVTTE